MQSCKLRSTMVVAMAVAVVIIVLLLVVESVAMVTHGGR